MIGVCEAERKREIKLIDWSMAGNLSKRSSGEQIPRDICTRLKRYLYSAKCSWIIKVYTFSPGGTNFTGLINILHLLSFKLLNYTQRVLCVQL